MNGRTQSPDDHECRGSVTVWASLSLLLLLSMMLTAAEGVRTVGLRTVSGQAVQTASESILAEYCIPLWETYGILAVDPFYGRPAEEWTAAAVEARMASGTAENLSTGYYQASVESAAVTAYRLLGDDGGASLISQAAAAEMTALGQEGLQLLTDWISGQESPQVLSPEEIDALLSAGEDALAAAGADAGANAVPGAEGTDPVGEGGLPEGSSAAVRGEGGSDPGAESPDGKSETAVPKTAGTDGTENPVQVIRQWKQNAVLAQVLPADQWPSDEAYAGMEAQRHRAFTGTADKKTPAVWERAAFRAYLADRMSCCTAQKEGRRCRLETEQILFAKNSDRANLEAAVWRLLGLREVQNLAALAVDSTRRAQAEAVASSLAAATATPALEKVWLGAVLAAWAYLESVLDVRLLLSGGKVPLQKSASDWTSDLSRIAACLPVEVRAKPAQGPGLDYRGCMGLLLALEKESTLVNRTMQVMEHQIRGCPGYEQLRMDGMLCGFTAEVGFRTDFFFCSPDGIGAAADGLRTWSRCCTVTCDVL